MNMKEHYEYHHLSHQMGSCPVCMGQLPDTQQINLNTVKNLEKDIVNKAPLVLLGLSALTLWRYKYIIAAGAALYYYSKSQAPQTAIKDVTPQVLP